ncbi:MAG: hypothetical protein ABEJ44_07770 [Halanaeroarchaeum sp.]
MTDEHTGGMHLDVLVEDEFSEVVVDDRDPDVVVGAFIDAVRVGIDARDGSVDVYLGDLTVGDARAFASALTNAADAVEEGAVAEQGKSWTVSGEDGA